MSKLIKWLRWRLFDNGKYTYWCVVKKPEPWNTKTVTNGNLGGSETSLIELYIHLLKGKHE